METINYYVPSELHLMLDPETSSVREFLCRFYLVEEDGSLYLATGIFMEKIPDTVCDQICQLNQKQELTDAAVNQLLLPAKKQLIKQMFQTRSEQEIDISHLFSEACGYAVRNNQPIMLFIKEALRLNTFDDDLFSLHFTVPLEDSNLAIPLISEEYIMREGEQTVFIFLVDDVIYRATASTKNNAFHLQQIIRDNEMLHKDLFQDNIPLLTLYQRFTAKKSRLASLLHK